MTTQTIAQIPYDLTDPTSLKRFLTTLVGNLDNVLGYKDKDDKYVTDKDFKTQGASITELNNQVSTATEDVTELQQTQQDQGNTLDEQGLTITKLETFLKTSTLGNTYYDFNAIIWNDLQGRFEFEALGSDLVNPPAAVVAGDTYNVYIDSTKTNNSVWQYVLIDSGSINIYTRIGVNSSWTKLN